MYHGRYALRLQAHIQLDQGSNPEIRYSVAIVRGFRHRLGYQISKSLMRKLTM